MNPERGLAMRLASSLAVVAVNLSACSWFDESPPPRRAAAQTQLEAPSPPQVGAVCLVLVNQTATHRSPQGATTDWNVRLENRCAQLIPSLVEVWVLDRNNTAIGYEARRVTAPANAVVVVTGQIAVPRRQSQAIASTITRYGVDPSQAALQVPAATQAAATSPAPSVATSLTPFAAPAAAPPTRDAGVGRGDTSIDMTVLGVTWQGSVAVAQVEFVNGAAAPAPASNLTCDFIALDQILGRGAQRVPALRQGERTTVTVTADVGGQLVDRVLCTGT